MKINKFDKFIIENYKSTSWEGNDGFKITIGELEEYLKDVGVVKITTIEISHLSIHKDKSDKKTLNKIERSDLKYPIIIAKSCGIYSRILDGNHRLQKAINNSLPYIKAKVLDLDKAPIEYKNMFL